MSSFTDTTEREAAVDFVTYFQAGTLWAQRPGAGMDPENACGLRSGWHTPSLQETEEIPAKSDACEAPGMSPIDKVVYVRQDDLTAALMAGEVDAMAADSPVTCFAVKTSGGALEEAGEVSDSAALRLAGGQGFGAGGVAAHRRWSTSCRPASTGPSRPCGASRRA